MVREERGEGVWTVANATVLPRRARTAKWTELLKKKLKTKLNLM